MKITKDQFKLFQDEFETWRNMLGLTNYRIIYAQRQLKDGYALISINEPGKCVILTLTEQLEGIDADNFDPRDHAKHEALHLATHRLKWLGEQRYIREGELDDEWESLVRRLQAVIDG
jgi:hypothetical protein